MSVKSSNGIFLIENRIDAAIAAHLSEQEPSLSRSKSLKFHWLIGSETFLVTAKICRIAETFKVKHELYDFAKVGEVFQGSPTEKTKFIRTLQNLPKISLSDDLEERLLEKVEKRVLENFDKRVFPFHVDGKEEPFLLMAEIEESAAPFFKFETSVLSHEEAIKTFDGCPLDKEVFIGRVQTFPPLPIEEEITPPEEKISAEPFDLNQKAKGYEYKGVFYRFSQELQKGLQNERGADHFLPVKALQACLQKKHAAMMDRVKKNPQKNHRFDYYFNYHHDVLNLVIEYFPSPDSDDSSFNFRILTAYFPKDNAIKIRHGFSDILYENFKKQLPKIYDTM